MERLEFVNLSQTQFTAEHPVELRNRSLEPINSEVKNHIQIYTDGSKSTSRCGCAFFVSQLGITKQFPLKYLLFNPFSGAICNIREHKLDQDKAVTEDRYLLRFIEQPTGH